MSIVFPQHVPPRSSLAVAGVQQHIESMEIPMSTWTGDAGDSALSIFAMFAMFVCLSSLSDVCVVVGVCVGEWVGVCVSVCVCVCVCVCVRERERVST